MSTHEIPVLPPKRRSWLKRPSSSSGSARPSTSSGPSSSLPVPTEGQQLNDYTQGVPLSRAATADSPSSTSKRWSASLINGSPKTSTQNLPDASHDLQRTSSAQPIHTSKTTSRISLSSMIGGFPGLSLSRTSTNTSVDEKDKDKERGRSTSILRGRRSSSQAATSETEPPSRSQSRARSQSPFSFRRFRRDRGSSPQPSAIPLANSDVDLSDSHSSIRPQNAFTDTDHDSDDETVNGETTTDGETDDDEWSGDGDLDLFDPVTERNTEANAFTDPTATGDQEPELDVDPDPLGEGVNVVVPPEPYFPSTLNSSLAPRTRKISQPTPRRRKSTKHGGHHEPLEFKTSRPVFQRDRCTITVTQGDPDSKLGPERRRKRYVVASDMSEESRYAVEWGIGTVLRDGDEMLIVTVAENESRVDPAVPNPSDRTNKLRSQQERQGLAYILVRQATSLLQRTKLNVTIACQAWHAKNARHMILDVVDHNEPVMLIVGSRGLGQLKGILLGSTSHYLIQKCSVPVMVARRRLKRPPRRSAHLAKHRAHVSLAEAGIDRVAAKVDEDVRVMRESVKRDDDRRDGGSGSRNIAVAEGGPSGEMGELGEDKEEREKDDDDDDNGSSTSEDEGENVREGIKVAGN